MWGDGPRGDPSFKKAFCPESDKNAASCPALDSTQYNKIKEPDINELPVSFETFEGNSNSIDEQIDKPTEEVSFTADVEKTMTHPHEMVGNRDVEMKCKQENNSTVEPKQDNVLSSNHEMEHVDCSERVKCKKVTTVEEEVGFEDKNALELTGDGNWSKKEHNNIKMDVESLKNEGDISSRNGDCTLEVMDEQIGTTRPVGGTTIEVNGCVVKRDHDDKCEVTGNGEGDQDDHGVDGDEAQCVMSRMTGTSITYEVSAGCESVVVTDIIEGEHSPHVGTSGLSEGSVIIDEVADVNDKVVCEVSVEIRNQPADVINDTDVGEAATVAPTPNSKHCTTSDKQDVNKPNGIEGTPVLDTSHSSHVASPESLDDSLGEILISGLPGDAEIKDDQGPNIAGQENEQVDSRISECSLVSSVEGGMTSSQLADIDWNSQFPSYSPAEEKRNLQESDPSPASLINGKIEPRETTHKKEATKLGEATLRKGLPVSREPTLTKETSLSRETTVVEETPVSRETTCKQKAAISGETTLEKGIPISAPVTLENGASVSRETIGEKGDADLGEEIKTKGACYTQREGASCQHEDGSGIVRGLIHELSQMNKLLLRTKRDMETSRRKCQK